jgi:hypothetical protein
MCIRSADGGKSWNDCSLNVGDPISHNLYDAMKAESSIYIVGELGKVFRSSDQRKPFPLMRASGGAIVDFSAKIF